MTTHHWLFHGLGQMNITMEQKICAALKALYGTVVQEGKTTNLHAQRTRGLSLPFPQVSFASDYGEKMAYRTCKELAWKSNDRHIVLERCFKTVLIDADGLPNCIPIDLVSLIPGKRDDKSITAPKKLKLDDDQRKGVHMTAVRQYLVMMMAFGQMWMMASTSRLNSV